MVITYRTDKAPNVKIDIAQIGTMFIYSMTGPKIKPKSGIYNQGSEDDLLRTLLTPLGISIDGTPIDSVPTKPL